MQTKITKIKLLTTTHMVVPMRPRRRTKVPLGRQQQRRIDQVVMERRHNRRIEIETCQLRRRRSQRRKMETITPIGQLVITLLVSALYKYLQTITGIDVMPP